MALVAVGLSGGVDSSVTAAMMLEAGHEVIGLSMRLYDAPEKSGKSCCSPDDLFDARHVADQLNIPFYVLNFTEVFKQTVIDPWAEGYRAGRTPNPCIRCNAIVNHSEKHKSKWTRCRQRQEIIPARCNTISNQKLKASMRNGFFLQLQQECDTTRPLLDFGL